MITRTAPSWHTEDWQFLLSDSIRTVESLWSALNLPSEGIPAALSAHREFQVRVPKPFLDKIERGNPDDPLLKQILPVAAELEAHAGFLKDPLAERTTNPASGLLHKYKSRVLLVMSGACAVNCRYCFRRYFPYSDNRMGSEELDYIAGYLQHHNEVNEVILSGGDPLVISNGRLAKLLNLLESISHISRVRIHTRLPVVIPQRIDAELLDVVSRSRLNVVMVTHSNHARELDAVFDQAMLGLRKVGVTLLNQAVLLRGINDSVASLVDLSERLFESGVLPYYLHLLDPVAGAQHFDVSESTARTLMQQLHAELPGFLIPRLVREIPQKPSKTLIDLHLSEV
ncbi:EF-P beta-lysylation protein EpmB [Ketobacter sp. MCCC 1A13808]|uniref:EF-P beta-lysylation protein EpmB n=1 Tax=Ketobacter sp. MCCC 1A13808 TaxID=2602738 RepID=UPI000F18CD52|nr:EF-P beta-lysylation protein EpmB [Ketobacter sp. MCCC 1A13808]MVF11639.1 EF-P beta-lysylation protein EpmB [Ketobacter sp. MCCC 1A13808]RLP55255.1 MAG: EF-P beta-lysylation protein EpmB [Ketobacter sp.]